MEDTYKGSFIHLFLTTASQEFIDEKSIIKLLYTVNPLHVSPTGKLLTISISLSLMFQKHQILYVNPIGWFLITMIWPIINGFIPLIVN